MAPMSDHDNDTPTLLVYAPVTWLDRCDCYGDLHDDDSTGEDPLYTYPDDYDEDGRYCRPYDFDCGDGLDDGCDDPAERDADWIPF